MLPAIPASRRQPHRHAHDTRPVMQPAQGLRSVSQRAPLPDRCCAGPSAILEWLPAPTSGPKALAYVHSAGVSRREIDACGLSNTLLLELGRSVAGTGRAHRPVSLMSSGWRGTQASGVAASLRSTTRIGSWNFHESAAPAGSSRVGRSTSLTKPFALPAWKP